MSVRGGRRNWWWSPVDLIKYLILTFYAMESKIIILGHGEVFPNSLEKDRTSTLSFTFLFCFNFRVPYSLETEHFSYPLIRFSARISIEWWRLEPLHNLSHHEHHQHLLQGKRMDHHHSEITIRKSSVMHAKCYLLYCVHPIRDDMWGKAIFTRSTSFKDIGGLK